MKKEKERLPRNPFVVEMRQKLGHKVVKSGRVYSRPKHKRETQKISAPIV